MTVCLSCGGKGSYEAIDALSGCLAPHTCHLCKGTGHYSVVVVPLHKNQPPAPADVSQAMVEQAQMLANLSRDILAGKVAAVGVVVVESANCTVTTDATWTQYSTTLLGGLTRLANRVADTLDN